MAPSQAVSQQRSAAARSMQDLKRLEVEKEPIRMSSQGKPPGMTEEQWNEIVQRNFSEYKNEEKAKKQKLAAQREQMKAELMQQVAS